jgi:3-hydroxyisobutyrate dehydrogenase-like beta-hydroxyacid dehydrogenase
LASETVIGCVGLGVMGEPICANLLKKSGCRVRGFDLRPEPLARLAKEELEAAASAEAAARDAAVVFLSLPGGDELAEVAGGCSARWGRGACWSICRPRRWT